MCLHDDKPFKTVSLTLKCSIFIFKQSNKVFNVSNLKRFNKIYVIDILVMLRAKNIKSLFQMHLKQHSVHLSICRLYKTKKTFIK